MSDKPPLVRYYNRQREEIDFETWGRLYERPGYRFLAVCTLGVYRVMTIWDGGVGATVDWLPNIIRADQLGQEPPVPTLFETCVFHLLRSNMWALPEDRYPLRWATEAGALRGHDDAVKWLLRRLPPMTLRMIKNVLLRPPGAAYQYAGVG
jgi:hypothetical protein